MATYRLVIERPANAVQPAKTIEIGAASGQVVRISTERHLESRRVSLLSATLSDPDFELFSELPDPSFQRAPVKFYLSRTDESRPVLVFDGFITEIRAGYPSPRQVTITGHDRSVDARRRKVSRVWRQKKSTQIASALAKIYGWTVEDETSTATKAQLAARSISFGGNSSDWDHLARELAADGLTAYMRGTKLIIRDAPDQEYGTPFTRGRPPVISVEVAIPHVRVAGKAGDVRVRKHGQTTTRTVATADAKGGKVKTAEALQDYFGRQDADSNTDRTHPVGPGASADVAHTEDRSGIGVLSAAWLQRKKDTLSMTCTALPDLDVKHKIALDGYGGKIDGAWYTRTVAHTVVSGVEYASTSVQAVRGPSKSASRQARGNATVAFETAETGK